MTSYTNMLVDNEGRRIFAVCSCMTFLKLLLDFLIKNSGSLGLGPAVEVMLTEFSKGEESGFAILGSLIYGEELSEAPTSPNRPRPSDVR